MVNKEKISISRNSFVALMVVIVLLVGVVAYLYGNMSAINSYYKFPQIVESDMVSDVEMQASVIDSVSDNLDEVDAELENIDVNNL